MAVYKGNQNINLETISEYINGDGSKTKVVRKQGTPAQMVAEYDSAVASFVPNGYKTDSYSISGVNLNYNLDGTASVEITYTTAPLTDAQSGIVIGQDKSMSANCSVSLQTIPLIQHPKFRWIMDAQNPRLVQWVTDAGVFQMDLAKAVQEYISAQGANDEGMSDYLSALLTAITQQQEPNNSLPVRDYLTRVLAGQTDYQTPVATFSLSYNVANNIPASIGDNVGKIQTLPAPFSALNSKWSALYTGATIEFDDQSKRGRYTKTWSGLPKTDGGGWDNQIYGTA